MMNRSLSRTNVWLGLLPIIWGCAAAPTSPEKSVRPALASMLDAGATAVDELEAGPADGAPDALASEPSREPAEDDTAASDKDEVDDGEESTPAPGQGQSIKHPLDGWTLSQIDGALARNPAELGSMSIGLTHAGALFNGVQMPPGGLWQLVDPDHAWGTSETIDYLSHCIERVAADFPDTEKIFIGHISARKGGHLSPHVSHQSGRDVDVGYYYLPGQGRWYARARAGNLDRARTWAFIKHVVTDTDVELILMDRSVQRMVRDYAIAHGEDRAWVSQLFDGGDELSPIIRHAKGHATHIHVRFYNPLAQETARRAYALLVKRQIIGPGSSFVHHKVKQGETLGMLAKKYHVSTKAIQLANGMKTTLLRANADCRIPQRGGGVKPCPRVVIPLRRLPPERTAG